MNGLYTKTFLFFSSYGYDDPDLGDIEIDCTYYGTQRPDPCVKDILFMHIEPIKGSDDSTNTFKFLIGNNFFCKEKELFLKKLKPSRNVRITVCYLTNSYTKS